jgi:cell division protein FtsQ
MPEHAVKTRRRPGTGWVRAARARVDDLALGPEPGVRQPGVREPEVTVDPRIERRRRDVHREQTRRRLRALRAVVIAVVAALLADAVLHSPLLDVRRPRVSGEVQTAAADILRTGGLTGHPLMVTLDLRHSAAAIERLPWIATARVRRSWPDTVIVTVTERVPVAIVVADLVDASGRVLSLAPGFAPLLPVRIDTGAKAPALPPPGGTIPGVYRPGVEVAASIPPALRADVQAVLVRPDGTVRLALTSGASALLGDSTDLAAKFEAVLTIIERVQLGRAPIDVSVPSAPVLLTSPAAAATVSTHTGG